MRVETVKDTQNILIRIGYMVIKYNSSYYRGPRCPWEASEMYVAVFLSSASSPSEHEGHFQEGEFSVENLAQNITKRHIAMVFHSFTL